MSEPVFTMAGVLRRGAREFADRDALVFPEHRQTHGQLYASAMRWAKALHGLGVSRGENVGILLPTCPEFVEIMFGCALIGATAVPVNARYQPGELAYLVKDAELVALVTTGEVADGLDFSERLSRALPSLASAGNPALLNLAEAPSLRQIVCLEEDCAPGLMPQGDALARGQGVEDATIEAASEAIDPADIALILYTSGTTANPKGCMISNRAMVGNSRNLGVRYEVGENDKVWSPLPIFHIAGILPMTMILDVGGAYLTVPHFDAGQALRMLQDERATVAYPSFVTIMQGLLDHESFDATDLSSLRVMNSNFAVQPERIKHRMTEAMPHVIHVGTYGLTEAAGTICTSRLSDTYKARTERLGVPLEEWEVEIRHPETGEALPVGERGEICARGPNMLSGYYNDAEKTADSIRDGWLHTGDIGSFDEDGTIMFHGRTKDMLKVGGENVAAAEIEAALQTHPAVKLAQVVGIPDEKYAEVPAAFIECDGDATASEEELIAHCKGQIANFKLPRVVRFVDEWPMSTSKIQKFKLRGDLCKELGLEG